MIRIEEFTEEFEKGVLNLLASRINREDIKVLISPFIFHRLHDGFVQYMKDNMKSDLWNILSAKAKFNELTLLGVTFGPTEGWPSLSVMLSFRDADILATRVKPIILESKKWL